MNKQSLVTLAATVLVVVFGIGAMLYDQQQKKKMSESAKSNSSLLVRDYSPTKGSDDAKVTIVEFFDPACETCKAFHPFIGNLMTTYPGKIKVVMRYAAFHQGSDYVVAMLEAARNQGKFWEVLEAAYAAQPIWASHDNPQPEKLWMQLGAVGLDLKRAQADMQNPVVIERLRQDMADAQALGVTKTPGFFVNGKPLVSFGYEQLKSLVEGEVRASY